MECQQAGQHALTCPPDPRAIGTDGAMHVADATDVRGAALRLTAAHEHKVVGSHTGGPATAPPDTSASWQRTDEQVPGDLSRGHLSDSAVLPNV